MREILEIGPDVLVQALQPMYIVEMAPAPQHPWAIPKLIREMTPEESASPVVLPAGSQ